jgi:hypothetical protein
VSYSEQLQKDCFVASSKQHQSVKVLDAFFFLLIKNLAD